MEDYRGKMATMSVDDEENRLSRGEVVKILDQKVEENGILNRTLLYVRPVNPHGNPSWIPKTNVREIRPDAQEIIAGAIRYLGLDIRCEVRGNKDGRFPTDFFTRENRLINRVNVPEEWIEDSDAVENMIRDELKTLLRNLGKEVN